MLPSTPGAGSGRSFTAYVFSKMSPPALQHFRVHPGAAAAAAAHSDSTGLTTGEEGTWTDDASQPCLPLSAAEDDDADAGSDLRTDADNEGPLRARLAAGMVLLSTVERCQGDGCGFSPTKRTAGGEQAAAEPPGEPCGAVPTRPHVCKGRPGAGIPPPSPPQIVFAQRA